MSLQKLANLLKDAEKTFDEFQVDYFAKKASNDYLNKKASLNESIKKIAHEENLNTEQIRRICEAANHTVNQHLFDTQDDKNVYFEVADVDNIEMSNNLDKVAQIREFTDYDFSPIFHKESMEKAAISDQLKFRTSIEQAARRGAGETALGQGFSNAVHTGTLPPSLKTQSPIHPRNPTFSEAHLYNPNVSQTKINQVGNFADAVAARKGQLLKGLNTSALKSHFSNIGSNLLSKLAEKPTSVDDWEISALDPKLTLITLKEKIAAVNELAREKREANEYKIKEAHWKLYNLVKDELQETPYFKVAQVIALTTSKHEILEDITEQLLDNKVITDEDVFAVVKTAGEFDKEHLIVKWTEKYAQLLSEQELLFGAEKETEEQLKILAQELK
jgi:hypothetical protein